MLLDPNTGRVTDDFDLIVGHADVRTTRDGRVKKLHDVRFERQGRVAYRLVRVVGEAPAGAWDEPRLVVEWAEDAPI